MSRLGKTLLVATAMLGLTATDALANRGARSRSRTATSSSQARNAARVRRPAPRRQANANNLQRQQQQRSSSSEILRANKVKLSSADKSHLKQTAQRFEAEIRKKFTPVVDLHITKASRDAGVKIKTINGAYSGSGGQHYEISGANGREVELVMTGGASGHVMQPKYGGVPMSTVEQYGKSDTVMLTHKAPGASGTKPVVQVPSRGLVTQEGFKVKLTKGEHTFYYFRRGPRGGSGGEGSEPELRTVKFTVN